MQELQRKTKTIGKKNERRGDDVFSSPFSITCLPSIFPCYRLFNRIHESFIDSILRGCPNRIIGLIQRNGMLHKRFVVGLESGLGHLTQSECQKSANPIKGVRHSHSSFHSSLHLECEKTAQDFLSKGSVMGQSLASVSSDIQAEQLIRRLRHLEACPIEKR